MKQEPYTIFGVLFLILASLTYQASVSADSSYKEQLPPEISGAEFPNVISYLDNHGVLWVFWRDDSQIFFSNLTDISRWDITTSYKDFFGEYRLTYRASNVNLMNPASLILIICVLLISMSVILKITGKEKMN